MHFPSMDINDNDIEFIYRAELSGVHKTILEEWAGVSRLRLHYLDIPDAIERIKRLTASTVSVDLVHKRQS